MPGNYIGSSPVVTQVDGYNKSETDTLLDAKLPLAGGTLTGALTANGGFASPNKSSVLVPDGTGDNDWAFKISNLEATDGRSYGLKINAGSTTDEAFLIQDHDASNLLLKVIGSGAFTQNGGAVFNEVSADVDFRVESNGNANMLFVDGGNDAVGIGTSSPSFESGTGTGLEIRNAGGNGAHVKLTDNASGAGGSNGFDLYAFNTSGYIENYEAGSIVFRNNGSERMRIHNSGVVSAPYGIELGSGLDATAANTLTDYEEGTWTAGVTNSTMSANNTTGYYRKVGRLVSVSWYSGAANFENTNGNSAQITGLPFTSSHATQHYGGGFLPHTNAFSHTCHTGYVVNNNTNFVPVRADSTTAGTSFGNYNTRYIMFNAVYMTAES